jgi:glycosyltransferase involved in cell wall biosynthesis
VTDLSVIICTHNPHPDYLDRVLKSLAAQTLPKARWELLLIDNASNVALAEAWDLSWQPSARHIREHELGLTPARLRGIREAQSDNLVYVDDDNLLAPDYLETALRLLNEHPNLGAIGAGVLEPAFEVPPPPELEPHLGYLTLRQVPEARWGNFMKDQLCVPWGAGLCVRRAVAQTYERLVRRLGHSELLDRRGDRLYGHGDLIFSCSALLLGQGFGVFPALRVTHLIRAERVSHRYILALVHDSNCSAGVFNYLWTGEMPDNNMSRIESYLRLCLCGLRRGPFAMKMRWATMRGVERASTFIREQHLLPLVHRDR